jgi:hypothetical protein
MDANTISNLIFMIALIFIAIGMTRAEELSKPQKETIKYIPRSLEEEAKEPVSVETIFKSMFENQTPWIGNFNDANIIKRRTLDKNKKTSFTPKEKKLNTIIKKRK